ncbi:P-loop containing nucleoside triphosphate hydrolase protein [Chlamydoabsidia padenii]|nr:P-loop containing nucleoside triphosphate hydrolase protein [Chlamydoabsidia padenii]
MECKAKERTKTIKTCIGQRTDKLILFLCRSVPLVLQFPTMERTMAVLKSKRLPKRSKVAPIQFSNASQYKDVFKRMIHEHLQIMLMNNALHYYSNLSSAKPDSVERHFRSKGLSFYQNCQLQSNSRSYTGSTLSLMVRNRESSYKYGKDDIWVISKVLAFDASTTFLARSTFYGPSSNGTIEIECITPRDTRVASSICMENSTVFALRTISAGTEFMMIDSLETSLDRLPLLPNILKVSKRKKQPELHKPKSAVIQLTSYDNIDIKKKIDETTQLYNLNVDQESVLRSVAKSIIVSPGWSEEADEPITLVHGVFGSGKSFLAAVLIIFLRQIIDSANQHREPEDQINFKIMISCFTNVAVDRILTMLVKLGYDEFVRIGSLKKITKSLLPYTVKAKLSGNEELKELEHMLEDPHNSDEESDNIARAIQRFRRCENMLELHKADVVGTTCSASCFEIFSESTFPFILMDECSQVMEPLSLVPLVRFQCNKMVMIGDPKQLPPTIPTQADDNNSGMGLDKPLFSRLVECHPRISGISSKLFYDRQLLNGSNVEARPPLINGLPPLLFVNVLGNEQRSIGNSFWNRDEVTIVAKTLNGLSELGIPPSDIGVISLYKEQADKIQSHLANNSERSTQNIQISTVDAFQGAEKEIIILSTVRTSNSGFIDKHPRVNVALTRARRHLIVLGNEHLLRSNETWSNIINECQGNKQQVLYI